MIEKTEKAWTENAARPVCFQLFATEEFLAPIKYETQLSSEEVKASMMKKFPALPHARCSPMY